MAIFSPFERVAKCSQADIESDCWQHVANLGGLWKITRDDHEPFIGFALDRERLDRSFHFAVQADADRADMLNTEPFSFKPDAVAMAWEKNRVESVASFETRITGLLLCFDATKEVLKRFIEPTQRGLSTAEI